MNTERIEMLCAEAEERLAPAFREIARISEKNTASP